MWIETPPETEEPDQILLLRAKPGHGVTVTLTGAPLRCYVHFAAGRSWPCTNYKCVLCSKGISKRFYAYYPVAGRDGGQAILELTAQVEASLIKQMGPLADSPCGQVTLQRPYGRRNLPCSIKWKSPTDNLQTGGEPLSQNELKAALMRIWKLPKMNGQMIENDYLEKLNEAIRLRTNTRKNQDETKAKPE